MATKSEGDSCYKKAGMDEPIFVLRATDRLAPGMVEAWADEAEEQGVPEVKVSEARHLALRMREWQAVHGSKRPD
jgi:hypothetical protein